MSNGEMSAVEAGLPYETVDPPPDLIVEPPILIEPEDVAERVDRLTILIADNIVPRLLNKFGETVDIQHARRLHPGAEEVAELSRLVLGPEHANAADYILSLKNRGVSLDTLHTELLEPTARYLGDLWTEDRVDFLDVTIAVRRLQQLVHLFADLDQVGPYDEKRRALIAATPGEQHSFGNVMIQRFFRSGGWYVCSCPGAQLQHITALVAQEWFGIVGLSLSTDRHLDSLKASIAMVRKTSVNKTVGIMVGGPAFAERPELAMEVGADGTAVNAPAAVILAKKLLVPSLLA
jgi:methanogenic corrinoid protein MtbC1